MKTALVLLGYSAVAILIVPTVAALFWLSSGRPSVVQVPEGFCGTAVKCSD